MSGKRSGDRCAVCSRVRRTYCQCKGGPQPKEPRHRSVGFDEKRGPTRIVGGGLPGLGKQR